MIKNPQNFETKQNQLIPNCCQLMLLILQKDMASLVQNKVIKPWA